MIQPSTADRLAHRLAREQAASRLPSLTAGLVRDGALVWSGASGTVDGRPTGTPSVSHLDLASFCFTRTPYDPDADVPGGVDPTGWR